MESPELSQVLPGGTYRLTAFLYKQTWIALRHLAGRVVCCFSSDGSQMEGNTAEATRWAGSRQSNRGLLVYNGRCVVFTRCRQHEWQLLKTSM